MRGDLQILNIMTCYNEMEYLPYSVQYYRDAGIDLYVIDNYSSDGSYEWLLENNVACHRIDTNGVYNQELMQISRLAMMHFRKPHWVIYGKPDEFIVTPHAPLRKVIQKCDEDGFNLVKCRKLEFYNTGEERVSKHPKNVYHHYIDTSGVRGETLRIHKYEPQMDYVGDFIQTSRPKACTIEGYVLCFEGTKSLTDREEGFERRQKGITKGLSELTTNVGKSSKKQDWLWKKEELLDVRNFEPLREFIDAA